MKFKKGDRVKVYATLNGALAETKGTVIEKPSSRLRVELEEVRLWHIWAHPKQCRKLRKKK